VSLALAAAVIAAAGCGSSGSKSSSGSSAASASAPCTPKGDLNAILWEGYAPPASIKAFEKQYPGVKVHVTSIGSNDEVFAKIRTKTGQYDIVPATTDVVKQYVDQGLVQPLDVSKIPNAPKAFAAFRNLPQAAKDGKTYGVANTWSADPILYNADVVKNPPASYRVLFDPRYKGKVAIYDDLGSLWVGAKVKGYDPWTLSGQKMTDVVKLMQQQRTLDRKYWSTGDDLVKLFASGEVDLATGWNYMYTQLKKAGVNVKRLVPTEGNLGWVDTLMEPVGSKNTCAANAWINWATSPRGGAYTAEASGYSVANPGATKYMTKSQIGDLHMQDPQFVKQIDLWQAVNRPLYQNSWNQVKNG
jgi:putative spermidine/putrescine transport system substrate-binding protein/spermidine/putrescine transport system substrate-binding protein